MSLRKVTVWIALTLLSAALLLTGLLWCVTFHPRDGQHEWVFGDANAPTLERGQNLKVMSYNVQFMAGKGYVFFFELPEDSGPDERPTPADISHTIGEVARIIRDENPDIVLLQEVDDGARRTDYESQLSMLLSKLPSEYCCHSSTFYWRARFVPHRRIMGAVGMKLSTISKYKITSAVRHSLAPVQRNPVVRQFHPKRAILETRLPVEGSQDLVILNLHLEAFPLGSDVMGKQVARLDGLLTGLEQSGYRWLAGGDFNLLPPDQYRRLPPGHRTAYRESTEMAVLYGKYQVRPSPEDVNGPDGSKWLTHFPNDPGIAAPDRTIDYIVLPRGAQVLESHVRQHDTLDVSDHLPILVTLQVD